MEFSELHNGYSVSREGFIKNRYGRILYGSDKDGYLRVHMNGKLKRIHRIVAECFLPNPNNFTEVNHKDGNKKNNHVDNLEWCSRKHNMSHAVKNGLHVMRRGESSIRAILKQDQVDYIKKNYIPRHKEFGQSSLGRKFGVTNSCVWRVVHGENW